MPNFLTEEQEMIRDMARKFSDNEVAPLAAEIDRSDKVPETLNRKAAELSFFGLFVDEEFGGLGRNLTNACLVLEEVARHSPSYAGVISVEIILCPGSIQAAGTEEQKQRWLPKSASGEATWAWASTEPAGGGNHPFHTTKITKDGDGFRVDGTKIYCTQGNAKYIMAMGHTEKDGEPGYGCAVVEVGQEGVDVVPYESKLGWRGTNTGTINFNNVYVPAENMLGSHLRGHSEFWPANVPSFIGHSATSVGGAQGLFDKTVEYVKERNLYGRPMDKLQPISYWIAESYAKLQACRALLYETTQRWDAGDDDPIMSAVCKAWICDTTFDISHRLLQMWGGAGIMDSTGVNRYFRDARTNMVAEGASEMHYDKISAHVLGNLSNAADVTKPPVRR